jgi:cyclase
MIKKRLIPVILINNGFLVQSKNFGNYQNLGNPIHAVQRLSEWGSDEIIYLDITKNNSYDIKRDDLKYKNSLNFLSIIKKASKVSFMPMTVGGKINSVKDVEKRFQVGADKVSINSAAIKSPKLIESIAKEFGSQCVVVSIDVKLNKNKYEVYSNGGQKKTTYELSEWIKIVNDYGAGEILLNSIDRDGSKTGFDLKLLKKAQSISKIPLIICGGVGIWEHFYEAFKLNNVEAVAAANIFHYNDQSVYLAKKFLYEKKINVRKPNLLSL